MATSGAPEAGLKKSSEEGSLKKLPGKGTSHVGEISISKQSSAIGSSQRIEVGALYNKQLRGTGTPPASDTTTLREALRAEDISQAITRAVSKQPSEVRTLDTPTVKHALRGEFSSQPSGIHTSKIPTLKQTLRGSASSHVSLASEVPTLKQALSEVDPLEASEVGAFETLTLKQALKGAITSHSTEVASSRQLSGGEETETAKQTCNVPVTFQTLEAATGKLPKGTSTAQKLQVGNLSTWKSGEGKAFEGGSIGQASAFGTSLSTAASTSHEVEGICQHTECRPSNSSEVGHTQQNKWISEQAKDCIWDSSLPASGSLSPRSSIDGSGIATGTSSVKNSTSANISEAIIGDEKSSAANNSESAKASARGDSVESAKSSVSRASNSSAVSDESTWSNITGGVNKPHKANDPRWEAILAIQKRDVTLGLSHFRLLKRLGCGDIGSVYLAELSGTRCYFAMKVMDKASLASRKKLLRAQTEREILQSLDHPFLPTLYTHFETDKFSCLVMEFCPGGDLHTLRQRQPGKHFSELAARFYAAEVLLSLEYLHMLGVVYRDLKPENVLVREDGHIMLSDFDLSLRCAVNPTLVKSSSIDHDPSKRVPAYCVQPACIEPSCAQPVCVQPSCVQPSCFVPRFFPQRSKKGRKHKLEVGNQVTPLLELIAEPTSARSMSFVGTHEYLAPEIIKGEGHGSAVDWWTFGIFLHELIFGKTPFKGSGNRATLFNVVGQPLRFPESPTASFAARDLIRGLLVKEPQHRLAVKRGATEIKQHPFFEGVNWALIRCTTPPDIPKPFEIELPAKKVATATTASEKKIAADSNSSGNYLDFDFF